jgi:hypothetical protein
MKACAFVLHTKDPFETMQDLAKFFQNRKIPVQTLNLYRYQNGQASVLFKCDLGADQVNRTVEGLENVKGVVELTKMIEK